MSVLRLYHNRECTCSDEAGDASFDELSAVCGANLGWFADVHDAFIPSHSIFFDIQPYITSCHSLCFVIGYFEHLICKVRFLNNCSLLYSLEEGHGFMRIKKTFDLNINVNPDSHFQKRSCDQLLGWRREAEEQRQDRQDGCRVWLDHVLCWLETGSAPWQGWASLGQSSGLRCACSPSLGTIGRWRWAARFGLKP